MENLFTCPVKKAGRRPGVKKAAPGTVSVRETAGYTRNMQAVLKSPSSRNPITFPNRVSGGLSVRRSRTAQFLYINVYDMEIPAVLML